MAATKNLILYKSDSSPPARAVLMLVDIMKLKLKCVDVNPVLREQDTPELTEKNPMRSIPALEDSGLCIADSHAIMIYLMEKYGSSEHKSLYPEDFQKRVIVQQRLFFDCGILFPRLRAIMVPAILGKLSEPTRSMIYDVKDAFRMCEAYLNKTKYIADDEMTIADLSAVSTLSSINGLYEIDGNRYPKTKQWLQMMSEKDFCKKVNEPGNKVFVDGIKALMENTKYQKLSKL